MKRILLIEDKERERTLFTACLEAEGYRVIAAENGAIGIQLSRECEPDLVLCDVSMPESDGYTVLATLRREAATLLTPFVFLSGRATRLDVRRGFQLGADDYLTKPCTADELLAAVATRLHRQTLLLELIDPMRLQKGRFSHHLHTSHPQLISAFRFIESHYREAISLREVAQAVGYSPAYLTDLMQKATGQTVNCWITEYRMAEARCLLLQVRHSVGHIAEAVGYKDACHFIRKFRQHHGLSPRAWASARFQADSP